MTSRAGAYDEQPLRMPGLGSSRSQSVPPARNVILFLLSDPESLKKLPAPLSPLSKVGGFLGHSCDGALPPKPTFLRPSSFLNIFTKYLPISNLCVGGTLHSFFFPLWVQTSVHQAQCLWSGLQAHPT